MGSSVGLKLFDAFERIDASSKQPHESGFGYLNRCAHPRGEKARAELESWFVRYPEQDRSDLRGKFRSKMDNHHRAAMFELILHEFLIRQGCVVKVHPCLPVETTQPDFLIQDGDLSFYLEAKTLDNDPFLNSKPEREVIAMLEKLHSPHFFLFVTKKGKLSKSLSRAKVVPPFANLLKTNPDEVKRLVDTYGPRAAPCVSFEEGGCKIQGQLVLKGNSEAPTLFGSGFAETAGFNTTASIRDRIKKKVSCYGDLDKPFVLAVNSPSPFDDTDSQDLFGTEPCLGIWDQPACKKRLTAVWFFCDCLYPWNSSWVFQNIYVNPFMEDEATTAVLNDCLTKAQSEYQVVLQELWN